MPRAVLDSAPRLNLRVSPETKAMLLHAALLRNTDLTDFVLQSSLREARAVIREADVMRVSAGSHQQVLDLLENPPPPNARLLAAALARPAVR